MLKRIAIIPARSGSTRLPNKNVMAFNGESLLIRKIKKILETKLFDIVWVSTDSKQYADLSIENGAYCPVLRDVANDNNAPVGVATTYALKQAMKFFNEKFQFVYQKKFGIKLFQEFIHPGTAMFGKL